jgi:acyl-CoA thioester hydrolase
MSTTPPLTYQQVTELPSFLKGEVEPEFIDVNGHMNVRHYLTYGITSADLICRDAGVDEDYRETRRMGVFAVEHHLTYFGEMRLGGLFSVHSRIVERSEKAGHLLSYILDELTQTLSCIVEIMLVHVNMDTRTATPFPPDVAARLDEWVARSDQITWPAQTCGAMAIRR